MRKFILIFISLFASLVNYGQQTDTFRSTALQKEHLLSKSKTHKTVGWFMATTGVPFVVGSLYVLTFPNDVLSEKGKVALVLGASTVYTIVGNQLDQQRQKKQATRSYAGFGQSKNYSAVFNANDLSNATSHFIDCFSC